MLNLFESNQQSHDFKWIVAIFQGNGASEVIRKANEIPLKTYYPLRMNIKGELVPLWRNYLFIEFRSFVTIPICRSSFRFINTINSEGVPILVPKNAINNNLEALHQGKFDAKLYSRRFYGKGSLVNVTDGSFCNRRVRLEDDITPDMPGNKAISISIGGWNGKIEVYKLAL